ncbi:MAG: hypothetical protein JSR78_08435, partial [Proteobacteria bacterium]|nr:hypothetical protein [Pseudomonadota bacterium]
NCVELNLYNDQRLSDAAGTLITERAFLDIALGQNPSTDKINFFGEDRVQPDGT